MEMRGGARATPARSHDQAIGILMAGRAMDVSEEPEQARRPTDHHHPHAGSLAHVDVEIG